MQKRVQRCTATREKYQTKPENGGIDYAQNRGIDSNIVLVLIWLWFLASGLSFRPGGGISNIYDTFRLVESPLELDWRIVDERPKQGRLEFWWNKTGFARRRTGALAVPRFRRLGLKHMDRRRMASPPRLPFLSVPFRQHCVQSRGGV